MDSAAPEFTATQGAVGEQTARQSRLPAIGYTAVQNLVSDRDRWNTVGVSLSKARGDSPLLDEKTRSRVQRVDRAIQTAERFND